MKMINKIKKFGLKALIMMLGLIFSTAFYACGIEFGQGIGDLPPEEVDNTTPTPPDVKKPTEALPESSKFSLSESIITVSANSLQPGETIAVTLTL
ncbi:MAG: hypothetical protein JXA66_01685, partial [Oligoflexia bacterium]|nr:hypothetical protein [Oligoflexia bacterium]